MKVVPQQTVSKGVDQGRYVLCIEAEEIWVVPLLQEEILAIVAPVEDVIVPARKERRMALDRPGVGGGGWAIHDASCR